jgi:hypothetical protein
MKYKRLQFWTINLLLLVPLFVSGQESDIAEDSTQQQFIEAKTKFIDYFENNYAYNSWKIEQVGRFTLYQKDEGDVFYQIVYPKNDNHNLVLHFKKVNKGVKSDIITESMYDIENKVNTTPRFSMRFVLTEQKNDKKKEKESLLVFSKSRCLKLEDYLLTSRRPPLIRFSNIPPVVVGFGIGVPIWVGLMFCP